MRNLILLAGCAGVLASGSLYAADATAPRLLLSVNTNGQKFLTWPLVPALDAWRLSSGSNLPSLATVPPSGVVKSPVGYAWSVSNTLAHQFFSLQTTQMSSNALLTANLLNRLAYGPTPDELERVAAIGPQAYIDEQLAPDTITETLDAYVSETTNGIPTGPITNWVNVVVTGTATSSNLYIYLTTPGDVYLDDIKIVQGTNGVDGPNLLANGDFESPLTPPWTVSPNLAGSSISTAVKCSGNASLHLVASAGGTTQGSAIWQIFAPVLTNGEPCTLSYWYLPTAHSSKLTLRLSGSGIVSSADDAPPPQAWIYATATGTATATPNLYVFLSGAGEAYVDDLKLVAGTVPEAGVNLLVNGDFESALSGPWLLTTNFTNTVISSTVSHSGAGSMHLVASDAGSGRDNAAYQVVPSLVSGQTYTVSYWYLPAERGRTVTVRLSGSGLVSSPDTLAGGLTRRLDAGVSTSLDDLRAWFCLHAVSARRQLVEILSQFLENHFVTYHDKSQDYLNRYYQDFALLDRLATDLEYREMRNWRDKLQDPNCTFYDLLKISAESPAMIIFLDTVDSKGNTTGNPPNLRTNIANENYARELFELFCHGVDNGYDQADIVQSSRCWTGWSIELVDPENADNPFAAPSITYDPGVSSTAKSNIVGVWAFNYKAASHNTNSKTIFPGKTVPPRFGPPWAGRNYQLFVPGRSGTNGIQDGYDVIKRLADLPFTMEYLSVKLCRVFVHDDFPNPTTRTELPEYNFYDYRRADLSPEAALVHACLLAWEAPGPDGRKGNIRSVLRTIFNSDLFRTHTAVGQKVKTPLEFVASSVRAFRAAPPGGGSTAFTDGYSFKSPLSRMGAMGLFNRAAPDGYPEAAAPWISAGTLAERLRYVQAFCTNPSSRPGDAGQNTCDPVALIKLKLPSTKWTNAGAVADYFLGIIYPGEGRANLDSYRTVAVNFLNKADDGVTASLFSTLSPSGTAAQMTTYDTRVRGLASLLLTLQRFQEQ